MTHEKFDETKYQFEPLSSDEYNLRVYIGGIVLSRMLGNQWRSVFIDGLPDHDLRIFVLEYQNGQLQSVHNVSAPGSRRQMSIKIEPRTGWSPRLGLAPIAKPDPRSPSYMGDFSSTELHGRAVKLISPASTPLTRLSVSHGIGYTAKLADCGDGTPDLYQFVPGSTQPRWLGHWFGITAQCESDSVLDFRVNGASFQIGGRPPVFSTGRSFDVIFDAVCSSANCGMDIDFPYYYETTHNGKNGIINETPVVLTLVESDCPSESSDAGNKKILLNRVACNAMLASEIESGLEVFTSPDK